jgi:hypothetical protein
MQGYRKEPPFPLLTKVWPESNPGDLRGKQCSGTSRSAIHYASLENLAFKTPTSSIPVNVAIRHGHEFQQTLERLPRNEPGLCGVEDKPQDPDVVPDGRTRSLQSSFDQAKKVLFAKTIRLSFLNRFTSQSVQI